MNGKTQRPEAPTYRQALESLLADWIDIYDDTPKCEKYQCVLDVIHGRIDGLATGLRLLGGYGSIAFDSAWAKTIVRYSTKAIEDASYAGAPMPEGWPT